MSYDLSVSPVYLSSIDERALQADLLDPTEFLYATERRFLSSSLKSPPSLTTDFMKSFMSSNLSVYSAS